MTAGLIALAAALAVAMATGLAWRRSNGRMRSVAMRSPRAGRRVVVDAGLATSPERVSHAPDAGASDMAPLMTGGELGESLGQRATLVQFSTAFCAPCRATRRILAEVAGMTDGVAHVEIDAESHLDLVRRLDIRRTPTVLVLGPDGRIAKRATGQPRKADVIAALGDLQRQAVLPTDQIGKADSDSEPNRA